MIIAVQQRPMGGLAAILARMSVLMATVIILAAGVTFLIWVAIGPGQRS